MISWLARTTAWHLRPLRLARCFPHICLFLRGGRDQDHFGGAIPYWACLPERLKVADQDRGVHKSDEMRARASGEGDRLASCRVTSGGGVRVGMGKGLRAGNGEGLSENRVRKQGLPPRRVCEALARSTSNRWWDFAVAAQRKRVLPSLVHTR